MFSGAQGAFWALMVSMLVGVVRMVLSFAYPDPGCGEPDTRPALVARIHYMYFAVILFVLTAATMVIVSLCTEPPSEDQVAPGGLILELFFTSILRHVPAYFKDFLREFKNERTLAYNAAC